ncbi:unnamed protein product (macronuclear) [Paramecium tetraurelia]|uniref:Coatomer subunit epsilon n=1 Tax=Paramecium tetraurelia TaxID=5888 RepID=A0D1H0_PARTE|nr:uncharacterized protein GSPATT00012411001 [Paramecium tetraurelia]CAK76887.1 unnamed protein product [Paramecium tetraurelia]|eukprot:XP_001444284.1 hypothetical protein (macronuclear) [Paramecium tetraurelia strain d4-2]
MNLNLNLEDYESALHAIETKSLKMGVSDPLDPQMSQIFYLYGLIEFKKIENTLPFQDVTQEFKKIDEFLTVAAEICEDDDLLIKIYSLIGDLYFLVDLNDIAELSYLEAIKISRDPIQQVQLYIEILQLRIVFTKQEGTAELFQKAKQLAFDNNSHLLDAIFKLEEEYVVSIQDSQYTPKQENTQGEIKLRTSQKYKQTRNLGVFGSYKRSNAKEELMN